MAQFPCTSCGTSLTADGMAPGSLVRCPSCMTPLRVPQSQIPVASLATSTPIAPPTTRVPGDNLNAGIGRPTGGRKYGFNCGYCSSRLEASEGTGGQSGSCPTCGNDIVIPILDRFGRLIDPSPRKIIKQDPHPVHAYATSGSRAPKILKQADGKHVIQCARCSARSTITANNCRSCGMPFTMEGTTVEATGSSNGFAVSSLILGIVGLPMSCIFIPSILAVIFGVVGYNQASNAGIEGAGSGKGMAIAGIILGLVGGCIAIGWYIR